MKEHSWIPNEPNSPWVCELCGKLSFSFAPEKNPDRGECSGSIKDQITHEISLNNKPGLFSRPMTIGTYTPTESFRSAPAHIAVCFEDDSTLVAVTGYADDPENVAESIRYARLFAASGKMFNALKDLIEWVKDNQQFIEGEFIVDDLLQDALLAVKQAKGETK